MERTMCLIPVNPAVDYWQQFWVYRVNTLLTANELGAIAKSPRLLINNILLEIQYNGTKNKENWKLFRKELEDWRREPNFKNLFGKECGTCLSKWRKETITDIFKDIIVKMDEGIYYRAAIKKLIKILSDNRDNISYEKKNKIQIYSDIIIVELLSKGYILKDIARAIYHPDILMSDLHFVIAAPTELCLFGREFKECDYSSKNEYYNELSAYFRNLPVEDKVNIMNLYYERQAIDAHVIVKLVGVKGSVDTYIGDINIYSLDKRHYLTNYSSEQPVDYDSVYAAIPVKYKSAESSKTYALDKLSDILSLIEIRIGAGNVSYSEENVIIEIDGSVKINYNPSYLKYNKITVEQNKRFLYKDISNYITVFKELSNQLKVSKSLGKDDLKKLNNSVNWIHKAENTKNSSDRLLYSWIAIESLLKPYQDPNNELTKACTIAKAKKILKALATRNAFYNYVKYIANEIIYDNDYQSKYFELSDTIKAKLYKNSLGKSIPYNNIFNNLTELIEVTKEESIKTELQEFQEFYKKDTSGITNFEMTVGNELTIIYWFRNIIVHNAMFPEYEVKYYANRAMSYAKSLLNAIRTISAAHQLNVSNSISAIISEYKTFSENLKERIETLYKD